VASAAPPPPAAEEICGEAEKVVISGTRPIRTSPHHATLPDQRETRRTMMPSS
jgi:hypothetical protein